MPAIETYLTAIVVLLTLIAALLVGVVVSLGTGAMVSTSLVLVLLGIIFMTIHAERQSA
ncbi:hypothetical protein SAMN05421858_1482 [Haladaptatus litoreus]|uniref:Uncharacterized protein n=1 Tax=Haladaptatus litoreus TaxID=553468 RepID=A0A1N6YAQ5_9EURY|nr:hypothetical protein [Haladaptatus litoreus]SIR11603.1 hypothetical protein SAMN05421858_1482 [Haladaptatus litoreus]